MGSVKVRRLTKGDEGLAAEMFAMMAAVFEEDHEPSSAERVAGLVADPRFWALAAMEEGVVIGGLTAHTLPITHRPVDEVFIYDLAVREDQQRRGLGRQLVAMLRQLAAAEGLGAVFVPADREDTHALAFYDAIGGEAADVVFFTFDP